MSGSKTRQHMSGSIECPVLFERQLHIFAYRRLLGVQLIYRRWYILLHPYSFCCHIHGYKVQY